ncbi:hypothetical protein OHJ21_16970 [Virgibacillus sp. LDC1]|nr:hypothetical protein [Virgibacillus sp. LDC1]
MYLGVKDIHLGPTLPAFLSPNVAEILVHKFGIGGITNVEEDIRDSCSRKRAFVQERPSGEFALTVLFEFGGYSRFCIRVRA